LTGVRIGRTAITAMYFVAVGWFVPPNQITQRQWNNNTERWMADPTTWKLVNINPR
jgi:hypothetical protein